MKVYGIVGWKNSGKTGLVERLVSEFAARGYSVSTVKHAHHRIDVDQPGTDSHRHRLAGARQVLLASQKRWALMTERAGDTAASLEDLLGRLDPVDLVIVEGFKAAAIRKIEAHRQETGQALLALSDEQVRAVASDAQPELDIPVFELDDTNAIADFIERDLGLRSRNADGSGDRFALPPGVDWIPVDEALGRLKNAMRPLPETEVVPVSSLAGRVLAEDVLALRSSPPVRNSAVDGYAFARDAVQGDTAVLALREGRAEPGRIWQGKLEPGSALRILTGAPIPEGADTVALQENVKVEPGKVSLGRVPKKGANTRDAGEDLKPGSPALARGRRITAADMALLASAGCRQASVHRKVRVGVISTGNELVEAGSDAQGAEIFDANRPMLLALAERWQFDPVDLGCVQDSRDAIAAALERGKVSADAIITSGGASAGDEDHIADLLEGMGTLDAWRIAVKPGRPLAFGRWQDIPVFGLPGNPVAAFVCAVIFVRPALLAMAGQGWQAPKSFDAPAAFTKNKRPGRREYLRARLNEFGHVEVFHTEGSGRVSGLSWADGLVELPDGEAVIVPGTPVRYIPFSELGL